MRAIRIWDEACNACPFAGKDADGKPCCWLPSCLTNFNTDPEPFGMEDFPQPAPEWCILRREQVIVTLRNMEEE